MVYWEDRFHDKLDLCLRRAIRSNTAPAHAELQLFFDDVRGNGAFGRAVRTDWPKLVGKGLPKSAGPIDYLVCVADADKATDCCPIEPAPPPGQSTEAWVKEANKAFTAALRAEASIASERVFGFFLRWSQESLLIAAHDVEATWKRLGCTNLQALQAFITACKPSPHQISDHDFTDHFRKAEQCLAGLLQAGGAPNSRKGAVPRDDALEEASRAAIDKLCARVTDLAHLATHIASLG